MQTKIIPVIHYRSEQLALENAQIAFDAGAAGVFLINMDDGPDNVLAPVAREVKSRWPDKLVGINYLRLDPAEAVIRNIADGLDMTWTDKQLTHTSHPSWEFAEKVRDAAARKPGHLVFAGVAFKHQRAEPRADLAALAAVKFGFIPTTSGPATGVAAEVEHVARLRAALGDAPLAIASGITPENVEAFAPHLSHILVATGVSSSFYALDFEKLYRLCAIVHRGELKEQPHA
jgi:predicted TIM-barrel enzyme